MNQNFKKIKISLLELKVYALTLYGITSCFTSVAFLASGYRLRCGVMLCGVMETRIHYNDNELKLLSAFIALKFGLDNFF